MQHQDLFSKARSILIGSFSQMPKHKCHLRRNRGDHQSSSGAPVDEHASKNVVGPPGTGDTA
jgi:hypothetical protein